jgi:hypothetical protein
MKAWYLGNTTIRSPYRLKDGLSVLVNSPLHGSLDGWANESAFAHRLHDAGVVTVRRIQEDPGADASDVGRKWRAALMQLGFITPKLSRTLDAQGFDSRLKALTDGVPNLTGRPYEITPNGQRLLDATTVAGEQECFLRSLVAYQIPSLVEPQVKPPVFSPLRVVLELLARLEREGLDAFIRFEEMAWIVQFVRSLDALDETVQRISAYREERRRAGNKEAYDRAFQKALVPLLEGQMLETLDDYADCNMRYLKATGLFSASGRKLTFAADQHFIIDQLLAVPFVPLAQDATAYLPIVWQGAALPTDHEPTAIAAIQELVRLLSESGEPVELPALLGLPIQELKQIRFNLEERLKHVRERTFAERQRIHWEEILPYLRALTTSAPSRHADIPKDEAPAYLEWAIWRAFLAVNSLVNAPWEARRFQIDQDFLPTGTAPGGGPDMIFEFPEYVLVVEVTLTSSSRQEAAEGEPVRRHVATVVEKYEESVKPVFGLFIANTIDSNTAETFRIGVWYKPDDTRLALRIVPFTLDQFIRLFVAGFRNKGHLGHQFLQQVLRYCRAESNHDAPVWKRQIEQQIVAAIQEMSLA